MDAWRATGEDAFVAHRAARMALVAKPADPAPVIIGEKTMVVKSCRRFHLDEMERGWTT